MEDSVKKPLMIVVVIVCFLVAGFFVFKNIKKGGVNSEIDKAFDATDMTWILCADCGHSYQQSTRDFYKYQQDHIDLKTMTALPIPCPKCGKDACYGAVKCEKCENVFFPGQVKGTYSDTCPKCKFSKQKQQREGVGQ